MTDDELDQLVEQFPAPQEWYDEEPMIRVQRCDVCEGDRELACWKCQGTGWVKERGVL